MGQGCNNNSNCNNYFNQTTPDTGIIYTGSPIPSLGICTGDLLSEVEAVLLNKIFNYASGIGISIPDIDLTTCDLFTNDLKCCETCTDLPCLMQAYLTALCTLYSDYTTLQQEVSSLLNGPYNTACLSLGANPTLTAIIQELILEFCNLVSAFNVLNTTVGGFTSGINTTIGNFLNGALTSCQGADVLNKTGSGATLNFSLRGFVPIGAIIPYNAGAASGKFDSTGLGFAGSDCCGFAYCNGNNGTVDLREQFIVGVGAGAMGGAGTGPSNISNLNYGANALIGEAFHTLTTAEVPASAVSVSGNHTHSIVGVSVVTSTTGTSNASFVLDVCTSIPGYPGIPTNCAGLGDGISTTFTSKVQPFTGTFTGNTAGGGSKHNNTPVATALFYIQRVS